MSRYKKQRLVIADGSKNDREGLQSPFTATCSFKSEVLQGRFRQTGTLYSIPRHANVFIGKLPVLPALSVNEYSDERREGGYNRDKTNGSSL